MCSRVWLVCVNPSIHRTHQFRELTAVVSPTLQACYWRTSAHFRIRPPSWIYATDHRGGFQRGSRRAERDETGCPHHPHPPIPNTNYAPTLYRLKHLVKRSQQKYFSFVWNFKQDKVERKTMAGPICKGGLSMIIFSDVVESLNISWANRYCKAPDSHWCALLDSMLHKVGGAFLFQCNYAI